MTSPAGRRATNQYRQALDTTAGRIVAAVAGLWSTVNDLGEGTEDRWTAAVVPVVLAGQLQAATITRAYLASYIAAETSRRNAIDLPTENLIGRAIRNGADPAVVYRRPFSVAREAVGHGGSLSDALDRGLDRATSAVRTDITLTARTTAAEWAKRDDVVRGWRRVLGSGKHCALCASASTRIYHRGELLPIHNRCKCTTEPLLVGQSDPKIERPPADQVSDSPGLLAAATDPGVNPSEVYRVVDHGELGPVLYASGHRFDAAA
ncbi:MAG TPA: hypothetical protein VGB14_13430 [Acidimicrobiales bacterium]